MTRWRRYLQPAKDEVDSYVVVEVPNNKEDFSILLKVADCERNVKLWFPWSTTDKINTSRKKVAILQQALDKVSAGLDKLV